MDPTLFFLSFSSPLLQSRYQEMRSVVFRVKALLTAGGGRLEGKSIWKMQGAEKAMERTNTLNQIGMGDWWPYRWKDWKLKYTRASETGLTANSKGQGNYEGVHCHCQVKISSFVLTLHYIFEGLKACLWEHIIKISLMNLKCIAVKMQKRALFMLAAGKLLTWPHGGNENECGSENKGL